MCALAEVSRASYYRHGGPQPSVDEEESRLRDAMQRIALEERAYGYRRVTHALRAQGWQVNHKRVARLMRLDQLLAIRKRRFVATTDSKHDLEVAINAAASSFWMSLRLVIPGRGALLHCSLPLRQPRPSWKETARS